MINQEFIYTALVEVKHLYVQKQPKGLSIFEKQDSVKALNDACNEVLAALTSDFYPGE
jgi:hypothetical protein